MESRKEEKVQKLKNLPKITDSPSNFYLGFHKREDELKSFLMKVKEESERDGNTRPPDLPLEKPVCRSGSNS